MFQNFFTKRRYKSHPNAPFAFVKGEDLGSPATQFVAEPTQANPAQQLRFGMFQTGQYTMTGQINQGIALSSQPLAGIPFDQWRDTGLIDPADYPTIFPNATE